jgi:hypothetical protein
MPFNSDDRAIAIGRIPQTNYQTATAAAANAFVEQVVTDENFFQLSPEEQDNKGHSTGNRFPTESWTEGWNSPGGFAFDASSQNLGRHLLAVLGAVVSTQLQVGVHQHVFTPLDTKTTLQLPTFSILEQLAPSNNGLNNLWPSMICESLELSGDGTARIAGKTSWQGSGEQIKPSGVTWATHVQGVQGTQNYFYNTQSGITAGDYPDNSNISNYSCDIESWKLGIKNDLLLKEGYRPGCPRYFDADDPEKGVLRSECLLKDTMFDPEFVLRLRANSPEHEALRTRKKIQLEMSLTGGFVATAPPQTTHKHKLTMLFQLVQYNAVEIGVKDKIVTVSVKPKALWSNQHNGIVSFTLVNNIASYIV